MADKTKVFSKRDKNVDYMNQMLPVEDSFDIVQRDIQIGGKDATFYFIDGFTKDESMLKIMDSFFVCKIVSTFSISSYNFSNCRYILIL